MTGPFLVRVLASSVAGVGSMVGRLTAIGTLGSFAGTLLISYLLVPLLPNSVTVYLTSVLLMAVCLGYFFAFGPKAAVPLVLVLGLGGLAGWALHRARTQQIPWAVELYRCNSHFGQLLVLERADHSCRFYLNDFLVQNTYDPQRKQGLSHFTYLLSGLARANTTNIEEVLCIGLGIGIVPMDFARHGARVDVVEINPAVVPVATRFFDLDPAMLHLAFDDGRHYLNRCRKRYDAVILDAFLGDSSPSHLFTREAFASIQRVLRPGGTLVINSFGNLEPGQDFFAASLNRTLKAVFRTVRMHTSGDGANFFVATDRASPGFVHAPDLTGVLPQLMHEAEAAYVNIVDTDPNHGRVLTDDYNPAEYYDARNRERFRHRLALKMKGI
jgi:spermidine synthase